MRLKNSQFFNFEVDFNLIKNLVNIDFYKNINFRNFRDYFIKEKE